MPSSARPMLSTLPSARLSDDSRMRIFVACPQCVEELQDPALGWCLAELQDSGLYRPDCGRPGHNVAVCLQEQKFEVLYDLAANAILDRYYREAIISFTSALERFYEFYIRVICVKRDVEEDDFLRAWKTVAPQSERQLGAYIFVYLTENRVPPPLLKEVHVRLRNDVVHNGKIPTKQQAVTYGQAVLDVIAPVMSALKHKEAEHVRVVVERHVRDIHLQIEKSAVRRATLTISTIIRLATPADTPQESLEQGLVRIAGGRTRDQRRA